MEITDNHIDLRHLVADLQTKSEDKFLIIKSNRELKLGKILFLMKLERLIVQIYLNKLAKEEINKLKMDKENIENKKEKLIQQLKEAEEEISNLKTTPAIELRNNELKIRFVLL